MVLDTGTAILVPNVSLGKKGSLVNGSGERSRAALQNIDAALQPDTGVVSLVFVSVDPGTPVRSVKALPGFILRAKKPLVASKSGDLYCGKFDTSGTNLIDAGRKGFLKNLRPVPK